ncbi:nucleoside-binding protein [Peptoclostridium litorale DSM 5388]|uniref:CD4+ T-cell-stimulating antigen n=1 Tax=Peptoclostridium litorale DSM 5388 TaxID=1121324 RepID=A0A069RE17_PEPLI|nr:BMP family ABC transporter substrate-binding protein [Peptoclostridium litorale]KDR94988.1 CD4+ T-cell-stimulating antigen [Peptoclostridium litorale DSM 5388]SIN76985.1 nucleoside-binding protein [Peptoclostridium litorale DSM 5388]
MKKKISVLLSIIMMLTFALAGCGGQKAEEETPATEEAKLKVALVVAGGLGDRSFYDSSNEGFDKAKAELGVEGSVFECKNDPGLYTDQMINAAQTSDVIIAVGFEFDQTLKEVAPQFPDKKFIYIDNVIEGIDNLTSIDYMENEGAFLAGALAALESESGKIGMVGGADIPVIRNFRAGYEAGAKYVNPDVQIEVIFAESFEDPAKGKESALALYSKGVDIIFQVAGKTGEGVFEAAKDVNKKAIGVDSDQRYINPDVIVASMIKGVGLSVYESLEKIQNGTFESGTVYKYGTNENGVDIGYGTEDMPQLVSEETKAKIQELKEKISSKEITVPEV